MNWPGFVLCGCVALGFLCLVGAMRTTYQKRLIDNLPTSKTTGVFIGYVKLKGTAETEVSITSYLAETECVYYYWSVDEHWSRTITETYTDSNGKECKRTRKEEGWILVDSGCNITYFYLNDECGRILIVPNGAQIEGTTVFWRECDKDDPLYYGKGPDKTVENSTDRRRFCETAICLHAPICVMGQARERKDLVAAEIAADVNAPMFLISTRSEKRISASYAYTLGSIWFLGLLLCVGGFFVHDTMLDMAPAHLFPFCLPPVGGYLFFTVVGWFWMVYNSLINLRQRVRQALSLVDVQLKRRHDLISNLLCVAKELRDYERELYTTLAAGLRDLINSHTRASGHTWITNLLGLTEAYPELKSHDVFLSLQQNLTDTEDRIALARNYFNDIATLYNTQLEVIPVCFVAAFAGLIKEPLIDIES